MNRFMKMAGETSEVAGTAISGLMGTHALARTTQIGTRSGNPLAGLIAGGIVGGSFALPYLAGRFVGSRTKGSYDKANKAGVSNILPIFGGYRLGRRHATKKHGYSEM